MDNLTHQMQLRLTALDRAVEYYRFCNIKEDPTPEEFMETADKFHSYINKDNADA